LDRALIVAAIYEDRLAACAQAGLNIAPAVADHEARIEVEPASLSRVKQHSGLGLAACASVDVVVRANEDFVERKRHEQSIVNAPEGFFGLRPASDVGLVRDDDELEAGRAQTIAGLLNAGEDLDFVHVPRWARDATSHDRAVQYAVTVEEDGASLHGFA
jgi:hypothetical protein